LGRRRSPWQVILYLDERANAKQRRSLEDIFLERAGGTPAKNYAPAIGQVHPAVAAQFELSHTRNKVRLRVGEFVDAATAHPLDMDKPVNRGIPGHDHAGQEVVASHMRVTDPPLQWIVAGRCGFATAFDYRSD
jgi:hypothetical protein